MSLAAICAASRDALQTAFSLDANSCEVGFDGQPKISAGEFFLSVHPLGWQGLSQDWDLAEEYQVGVTLTMRIAAVPQDRWGLAAWLADPKGVVANGIDARARKVIVTLHQNQQVRLAANAYLEGTGGPAHDESAGLGAGAGEFVTALSFLGGEPPRPRGPDWFSAPPPENPGDVAECGVSLTLRFGKAQRIQGVPSVQQILAME